MHQSVIAGACFLTVVLVSLALAPARANPVQYSNWKEYLEATGKKLTYVDSQNNKCTHGGHVRNLCERCAKFIRNEVVFPLCCNDEDDVRSWCKRFLDFTPEEHHGSSS